MEGVVYFSAGPVVELGCSLWARGDLRTCKWGFSPRVAMNVSHPQMQHIIKRNILPGDTPNV